MRLVPAALAALGALVALVALPAAAAAERRLALVIGNDAYETVVPLEKAVTDARSVATALTGVGFEVTAIEDASRREMNIALSRFIASVREGDVIAFFYAGHGVEISGQNFLLPVDMPDPVGAGEDFVASEALSLSMILERLRETPAAVTLALLDACRDNPLGAGRTTRSIGAPRGLGTIAPPRGSFVIFSADAGQEALDRLSYEDAHPNSVFTRHLLPMIAEPGLNIRDLAVRLRRVVARTAEAVDHDQVPAYYDAMIGDFSFVPPVPAEPPAAVAPEAGSDAPPVAVASAEPQTSAALSPEPGPEPGPKPGPERGPEPETPSDAVSGSEPRDAPEQTTRAALTAPSELPSADPTVPAAPRALDAADRRFIQRQLARLGFDPGPADAIFGPRTRSAIRAWQRAIGAEASGELTERQIAALLPPPFDEAAPRVTWTDGPAAASEAAPSPEPAPGQARHGRTLGHQPSPFKDPVSGRFVDAAGCAREADGRLIFCP